MATTLRPVSHEDRLSLVEHLDELRSRLIVCIAAFVVALGVCLWQSHTVLDILNHPLQSTTGHNQSDPTVRQDTYDRQVARALGLIGPVLRDSAANAKTPAAARAGERRGGGRRGRRARRAARRGAPAGDAGRQRAVHGDLQGRGLRGADPDPADPALPGVRVRAAGVLAVGALGRAAADAARAVPVHRRRRVRVLPRPAHGDPRSCRTSTPTSSTSSSRPATCTAFSVTFMGAMGLLFQVPIGILAVVRMGIVSVAQLRHWRRYAIVIIAIVAAAAARRRPRLDDPRDDPAGRPLRGLYPSCRAHRASLSAPHRRLRRLRRRGRRRSSIPRTPTTTRPLHAVRSPRRWTPQSGPGRSTSSSPS